MKTRVELLFDFFDLILIDIFDVTVSLSTIFFSQVNGYNGYPLILNQNNQNNQNNQKTTHKKIKGLGEKTRNL